MRNQNTAARARMSLKLHSVLDSIVRMAIRRSVDRRLVDARLRCTSRRSRLKQTTR